MLLAHRTSFSEIGKDEGIATNILQNRLNCLTEAGIIECRPHPSDGRRRVYLPGEPAIGLIPVLVDLAVWGEAHTQDRERPGFIDLAMKDRDSVIQNLTHGVRGLIAAHEQPQG